MKTCQKLVLIVLSLCTVFIACEREFDVPPYKIPIYAGEANTTIQELKNKYAGEALVEITEDLVIKGLVVANDISGNIYKQIQLQDATAGICIAIDRNNIYGDFHLGQEVFVELKGLYFGLYGGYPQIGYKYSRNNDENYTIGQATWEWFTARAYLNDYPAPDKVVPLEISGIENLSSADVGKLVTVRNVYFEKGGQEPFAVKNPSTGAVQTESKILRSATNAGVTLTARNSSAANFSSKIMPEGVGSVTGILSVYNSTMQITFRDSLDCSPNRFGDATGNGTKESPWLIAYALENQAGDLSGWIEGYLVGTVAPGINESNPVTKKEDILFEAPFLNNTVVLAAEATERDYRKVVVVSLPDNSSIRSAVNLMDNAGNLGKKLKVTGNLTKQFNIAGLKVNQGTAAEYVLEKIANGTKEAPYNVAGVMQNQGATDNKNYLWAEGYVVGIWETKDANGQDLYPNNFAKFNPPFYTNLNLLLADSPDETNVNNTVCVQLPAGMRDVLSPMNNSAVHKQKVMLKGSFERYNTMPGIKSLQEYEYTGGTDPDPDPGNGPGSSADNPYSVAQGIAHQGNDQVTWTKGYMVGAVKNGVASITGPNDYTIGVASGWDSATNVMIADSQSETDINKCIIVNLPAGKPLRSQVNLVDNPANYGKMLTVKGKLRTYFGKAGLRDSAGETADFVLQ